MFKIPLIFLILASFFLCTTPLFACNIEEWAPVHLHVQPHLTKIKEEIVEEQEKGPLATLVDDKKGNRDFGYSCPGINPAVCACLIKIKNEFVRSGKRPKVLDSAAGHGLMAWKMLTAGAHVTMTEQQKETLLQLQQNIRKAIPFLEEGSTLESTCRIIKVSVLNFKNPAYAADQKYYLTWSGLSLHFFSPPQAKDYVKQLFTSTENNGYALATVNPPCNDSKLLSFYRQKEKEGIDFPGYCVKNRRIERTYTAATDKEEVTSSEIVNITLNTGNILPGEQRNGYFGKETLGIDRKTIFHNNEKLIGEYKQHIAQHVIDHTALRKLFENAGFITEDLFYIDAERRISIAEMSDDLLSKNAYFLAIIAKKPESNSQ